MISILNTNDHKIIGNILWALEINHNDLTSYAELLKNAILHIEPQGIRIVENSKIKEFRNLQINKKTYSEFTVVSELMLNHSMLMVTCTETTFSATYRGMQVQCSKLCNIILLKKNGDWEIYAMQILNT